MAVSRGTKVLFCLGTVCVLLSYLVSATTLEDSEFPPIHAVRHKQCKGGVDPTKGNNCKDSEDDGDDDVDDDVDDSYKVVGQVKVPVNLPESLDDDDVNDDTPEADADHFDVLGH